MIEKSIQKVKLNACTYNKYVNNKCKNDRKLCENYHFNQVNKINLIHVGQK